MFSFLAITTNTCHIVDTTLRASSFLRSSNYGMDVTLERLSVAKLMLEKLHFNSK